MAQVQQWAQYVFLGTVLLVAVAIAGLGFLRRSREQGGGRVPGKQVTEALGLYLFVLIGYGLLGGLLQVYIPQWEAGLILAQTLFLALPAVLAIRWLGHPVGPWLSFRLPSTRALAGSAALGLGAWAVIGLYMEGQSWIFPFPPGYEEAFAERVLPEGWGGWLGAVLTYALLPAFCEELLFRGALLGLLSRAMPPWTAIVLSGSLFGLLHMDPFRVVPTALLGFVLGWVLLRTRSLFAVVLLHFLHNGVLLTLGMLFGDVPEEDAPNALVGFALVAVTLGLGLLWGPVTRFRMAARSPATSDLDLSPGSPG